jgi:hypothetical protein
MAKSIDYMNDMHPDDWAMNAADVFLERETNGLPEVFLGLPMIRGRKRYLTALPACVLKVDQVSPLPVDLETDLIRVALEIRKQDFLHFKPAKEATVRAGRCFYSALFLEQLGPFLALPATAAALAAYVRAVDQGLAKPTRAPLPNDPTQGFDAHEHGWGRMWQPWEDDILRAWFGVRSFGEHEGRHAVLTEREWELVLQTHLKGRRTLKQVKVRITTLNRQLRRSLLVDGFLPRDKVDEFQRRALGERRIRVPRFRPRIKGRSYRGDNLPPVLDQPD